MAINFSAPPKEPAPKRSEKPKGIAARAVATLDNPNSLPSLIMRASKRLADAKSSAEVLEAKAAAEAALHYAKVTGAANDTHADCLRIITRAEIRMASEIDRGQDHGEVAKPGRKANVPASDNKATMAELGVSRQRVNEWRKVADAGEDKVEAAIQGALDEGRAPVKADIHKAAGIVKDKPKSSRNIFDEMIALWTEATAEDREAFVAYLQVSGFIPSNSQPVVTDQHADANAAIGLAGPACAHDDAAANTKPAQNTNSSTTSSRKTKKPEAVTPPPVAVSGAPFTNPRCQHPDTCHLVHSREECFDCTMAWAQRPKDEQIRLWAEAVEAARAAA